MPWYRPHGETCASVYKLHLLYDVRDIIGSENIGQLESRVSNEMIHFGMGDMYFCISAKESSRHSVWLGIIG